MANVKFKKTRQGPALLIHTICDVIEDCAPVSIGQESDLPASNIHERGRQDMAEELVKRFKEIGDKIEFDAS